MGTVCATRLLVLLLLIRPAAAQAQFLYTTNNGTITITGYGSGIVGGPSGSLTIPSRINELPFTSIGEYAFEGFIYLTSVTIPNTVTSLGSAAFQGCA